MEPTIKVGLGSRLGSKGSVEVLLHLLRAVIAANLYHLRARPETPRLYKSGVRYERERNTEEWLSIPEVLARKAGDCEDLACWRAAELIHLGETTAEVVIVWRKKVAPGRRTYHVVVRRASGEIEDPSGRLGMAHGIEGEV
jgi:hypothetical protein